MIAIRSLLNPTPEPALDSHPNQIRRSVNTASGKKLVIGSAYRPPGDLAEDLDEFNHSLGHIFSKQKTPHVLLAGDFNCSGIQWNDDPLDMGSANVSLPKPSSSKQFMTGRAPLMPKAKPTCYSSTLARPLTPCPTDDC